LFELLLFVPVQADLFVAQVARRIGGPGLAEVQVGPHSEAPAAGVEEFAQLASALDVAPSVPGPYLAERPVVDAAKIVVAPELVRMHVAVIVDAGDAHSAAVQPAAVPGEQLPDVFGPFGVFLQQLEVQIDPVNVVINSENVGLPARLFILLGLGQDYLDGGPASCVRSSVLIAPPRPLGTR